MNNQMNCVICEKQTHHFVIYTTYDEISQCMYEFFIKFIDVFHFIFVFFNSGLLELLNKLNVKIIIINFVNNINLPVFDRSIEKTV